MTPSIRNRKRKIFAIRCRKKGERRKKKPLYETPCSCNCYAARFFFGSFSAVGCVCEVRYELLQIRWLSVPDFYYCGPSSKLEEILRTTILTYNRALCGHNGSWIDQKIDSEMNPFCRNFYRIPTDSFHQSVFLPFSFLLHKLIHCNMILMLKYRFQVEATDYWSIKGSCL